MKIAEICTRQVSQASPEETVRDGAQRMQGEAIGTLVVVDRLGRPLGIVTDRDIALRCVAAGVHPARTPLAELMSAPVAWVRESQTVEEALDEMARLGVRRLPVVDERDRLVGILALDDVLVRELEANSALARALGATL